MRKYTPMVLSLGMLLTLSSTAQTQRIIVRWQGPKTGSYAVAFSPDSRTLASGHDGVVKLWDVRTGEVKGTLTGYRSYVCSLDFTPNGRYLVSIDGRGDRIFWDVVTHEAKAIIRGHRGWPYIRPVGTCVQCSPDGKAVAFSMATHHRFGGTTKRLTQGSIGLWEATTCRFRRSLASDTDREKEAGSVVAFHPDGRTVASVSQDHEILLREMMTGMVWKTFSGHKKYIVALRFCPNGRRLVSADSRSIKLWDLKIGKVTTKKTDRDVRSLSVSPDGQLVAWDSHHEIKLWDLQCNKVFSFPAAFDQVTAISFSPDGRYLALASSDSLVRLVDITLSDGITPP